MLREVAFAGLLVPAIILVFFAALLLFVPLDLLLARLGAYRLVWHPPLARLALFLVMWALLASAWPDS